jgi:hypothetical protein
MDLSREKLCSRISCPCPRHCYREKLKASDEGELEQIAVNVCDKLFALRVTKQNKFAEPVNEASEEPESLGRTW